MFGERIKRIEDPALLRGVGRFTDDIHLPGLAEAAFLRSPSSSCGDRIDRCRGSPSCAWCPRRLHYCRSCDRADIRTHAARIS